GVGGELLGDLVNRTTGGLSRLGTIRVQAGVRVALGAGTLDNRHGAVPGGRAIGIAGPQHDRRGCAHTGGERGLHLRGGRQAEPRHDVARLARCALHVLADLVQRNDGDEEQGEKPSPSAVQVLPVPAALAAVEDTLVNGAVEDANTPDEHEHWLPLSDARGWSKAPRAAGSLHDSAARQATATARAIVTNPFPARNGGQEAAAWRPGSRARPAAPRRPPAPAPDLAPALGAGRAARRSVPGCRPSARPPAARTRWRCVSPARAGSGSGRQTAA